MKDYSASLYSELTTRTPGAFYGSAVLLAAYMLLIIQLYICSLIQKFGAKAHEASSRSLKRKRLQFYGLSYRCKRQYPARFNAHYVQRVFFIHVELSTSCVYSSESPACSYEAWHISFILAAGSKGKNINVVPMITKVKIKLEKAETSDNLSTAVFSEQHS